MVKKLFLSLLLLPLLCFSQGRIGNAFTNGRVMLTGGTYSYDLYVQEPSPLPISADSIYTFFTAANSGTTNVVGLAVGTSLDNLTKLPTPVIGRGYGGAPANRQANCSYAFKLNGYIYVIATNGYGLGNLAGGEDRNVYLYRSTDGRNFQDLGVILTKSLISGCLGYGNVAVSTTPVNGVYEMLAEAADASNVWRMYRFQSASVESGWTLVGEITSLRPNPLGMYGGPDPMNAADSTFVFYHYGPGNGNLPTYLALASTKNLTNYVIKEAPLKTITVTPYGTDTDQFADAHVTEFKGKTYLAHSVVANIEPQQSLIYLWEYNGTLKDLLFPPIKIKGYLRY